MWGEVIITDQNGRIITEGKNIVFDFAQRLFWGSLFGSFVPNINTISLFTSDPLGGNDLLYYDTNKGVVRFSNRCTRHYTKIVAVDYSSRKISYSASFKGYGLGARFKGLVLHQWVGNTTPSDGLVLYLPFDEGTGTIAYDWSGNNLTGVLSSSPPSWAIFDTGRALHFSGYNVVVNGIGTNTNSGAKNTVCFWMKTTPGVTGMPISWGWNYYDLYLGWGGFGFNTYNGDVLGIEGSLNFFYDQWHYIGAVFYNGVPSSDNVELWVDGRKFNIRLLSPAPYFPVSRTVGSSLYIGSGADGYFFSGIIDDVRVYNRSLSGQEIALLSLHTTVLGAIAYFPCDFYLNSGDVANINWFIYL